jgi:hypothetical protein
MNSTQECRIQVTFRDTNVRRQYWRTPTGACQCRHGDPLTRDAGRRVFKDFLMRFISLVATIGAIAAAPPALAQTSAQGARPEALDRLVACRQIAASEARLACFDGAVAQFDTAQQQGDVVVVDRAQVREARRQLFGFQLPSVTLFDQGEKPETLEAIETTLVRGSQSGDNRWTFTLADESVWRQVDSERVTFRNREGEPVRIRRAALGSFLMTVGNSRAVRVRRQ